LRLLSGLQRLWSRYIIALDKLIINRAAHLQNILVCSGGNAI
jgi:hypothetical protein